MKSLLASAVLAGAMATALALAPTASAEDTAGCKRGSSCRAPGPAQNPLTTDFNSKNLPKGWTNEALWARPGASNPFGSGPRPPVLALD